MEAETSKLEEAESEEKTNKRPLRSLPRIHSCVNRHNPFNNSNSCS